MSGRGETGRRSGLKIRFPRGVRVRVPPSAPALASIVIGASLALAGCGLFGDSGPIRVAAIGELHQAPNPSLAPLGSPDALLLDATARGLVAHDSDGQIEPGIADRWTVIDNGLSYIFRLRDADWSTGRRVVAADVAWTLGQRMQARDLPMSIRGEFAAVESVRAMTTKVIEIRLTRPLPHFLDLLAHPALAVQRRDAGWGPLRAARNGRAIFLTPAPTNASATDDGEPEPLPPVAILWGARPAAALAQFDDDAAAAVFGGRFEHWPLLAAASIDGAEVRRDPVDGLFGLIVVDDDGLLSTNIARDAVAMAIDRPTFIERLRAPEWAARTTIRSPRGSTGPRAAALPEPIYPAWIDMSLAERRRRARRIIAASVENGASPRIRLALPSGPGASILFAQLRRDLGLIGVDLARVRMASDADLRLIDEVAPTDDPLWYLRRLGCNRGLLCDPVNDGLIAAMASATDNSARASAVAAADERLTRFGAYIPIAVPLRWSLAAPRLTGHRANLRGQHSVIRLLPPAD